MYSIRHLFFLIANAAKHEMAPPIWPENRQLAHRDFTGGNEQEEE